MLPTLTFCSAGLEAAYLSHAAPTRARTAARFAVFRFIVLICIAFKALLTVRRWCPEALLLLSAAFSCLPFWAAVTSPTSRHAWLARWCALATDVLQAAIGVLNHRFVAPSSAGAPPAAALVYLLHGSTVLWLHFYGAFSTLPLFMLLAQQSLVTMVLVAGSRSMCTESAGLRAGYAALHALLRRALRAAQGCRLPLLSHWLAATTAPGFKLVGPEPAAEYEPSVAIPATAAAGGAAAAQPDALARLCISYQLPVLLLAGFALSMWVAYRGERSSRLAWLSDLQQRARSSSGGNGSEAATPAGDVACSQGGSVDAGAGVEGAAQAAETLAVEMQREVEFELIGPLPSDADLWLQLALPCMLCIGMVARVLF